MKYTRGQRNAATIAALLFFAGVTGVAPAAAEDRMPSDTSEASTAVIEDISREQARQANEAAVEEAARAIEANARLELDIKLIGRTLVLIAGDV